MKNAADILQQITWNPTTAHLLGELAEMLQGQGKYISDLEVWLNIWKEYASKFITPMLLEKAQNIQRLKVQISKVIDVDYEKAKRLNFILEKESKNLTIINGLRVFFDNALLTTDLNIEHQQASIEELRDQNLFLFNWCERFEKLFNQSTAGEAILIEQNIHLLRENEQLKTQLNNLKLNQSA